MHIYIYIYIYVYERERESVMCVYLHVCAWESCSVRVARSPVRSDTSTPPCQQKTLLPVAALDIR